jgi:hypothetical protein
LFAHRVLSLAFICALFALFALSCGSRGRQQLVDNSGQRNMPQPRGTEQPASGNDQPRTRIVTELSALSGLPAGSEFEFTLRATLTEPVFQGSARIVYDSNHVEPVAAINGRDLPSGAVVLATRRRRDQPRRSGAAACAVSPEARQPAGHTRATAK